MSSAASVVKAAGSMPSSVARVRVAVGEPHYLHLHASAACEVGSVTAQDLDHTGSDGTEADEADADGPHCF